jgi:hypothetical protein
MWKKPLSKKTLVFGQRTTFWKMALFGKGNSWQNNLQRKTC